MMRKIVLCAVLCLMWPGPAPAQSVKSVVEGVGFVGIWAVDCSRGVASHSIVMALVSPFPAYVSAR